MSPIAIECRKISKRYGQGENLVEALKKIDLTIPKGELTLLVGPSGSGKTTLVSIITTILTPDEGEIFLLGENIRALEQADRAKFCRENIGMVFQSLYLIPTLTVLENITLPLAISGLSTKAYEEKALDLLDRFHLKNRAHFSPTSLSKGQQQRVAIARAMINDAPILVLDEPTSALDQTSGLEVMTLLREKVLHASRAVLVVTHDNRTFPFADRIIEMNDGQIQLFRETHR